MLEVPKEENQSGGTEQILEASKSIKMFLKNTYWKALEKPTQNDQHQGLFYEF